VWWQPRDPPNSRHTSQPGSTCPSRQPPRAQVPELCLNRPQSTINKAKDAHGRFFRRGTFPRRPALVSSHVTSVFIKVRMLACFKHRKELGVSASGVCLNSVSGTGPSREEITERDDQAKMESSVDVLIIPLRIKGACSHRIFQTGSKRCLRLLSFFCLPPKTFAGRLGPDESQRGLGQGTSGGWRCEAECAAPWNFHEDGDKSKNHVEAPAF